MKPAAMLAAIVLALATATSYGQAQLPLNEVVESRTAKGFGHPESVLMVDGFWAKSGSDVTVSVVDRSSTLIQMAAPVDIPVSNPDRSIAAIAPELTGSPGTGSVVVEIGDGVSLPNPTSFYAVSGIGIEENGNNPCLLTLWGRMVDPSFESTDRKLAVLQLGKCRSLSTFVDFKHAQLPRSAGMFIRGVLACGGHSTPILPQEAHSSTSWEIKGLKVRAGRVMQETDEVQALDRGGEFIRTNCVNRETGVWGPGWTQWNDCPAGQLMTGVRAFKYEDKWFTGLRALCKKPQRSLPSRQPAKASVGF